ncbi:MAG TPA: TolC family protein [Polyangiaceae bacterium]|nr:TolC family protein [Polyangiaceae bacterium]
MPPSTPPAPAGKVLSLDEAVKTALENQPRLREASASSRAADARVGQALGPLLPQVSGKASYQHSIFQGTTGFSSVSSGDSFVFQIGASQTVYDWGQTVGRYRASQANADVQRQNAEATRLDVTLAVKNSYFQARAQKALVEVARETLANQGRHLAQIEGFVEVGTRPRIDVVQARADRASAELSLLNAENGYAIAKAQLVQAMGREASADFEVSDQALPPIPGEDSASPLLLSQALASRPDVRAAIGTVRAQELSAKAAAGAYGPSLGVSTTLSERGSALDTLHWNWDAIAQLDWPIFQGGITKAQVAEARANVDVASAQVAALRQQVLLEVEQARLGVLGAKKALATSDQLVENSRERLTLAEGRYQTGAGSIIELADAQLALTTALGQRVQAEYSLSTARAALANALGRP